MNKIFNAAKIFVTGIFLCGIFLIGGKASAADAEAMQIFRETVAQTSGVDTRPFHQDVYFVMPKVISNLEFFGATEKDSLKLAGSFGLWMIDDNGNPDSMEIPFYVAQDNKNMTIYFQKDKKWQKMTSPASAANVVDMVTTPNAQELDKMIEYVKDVTVLKDNDTQRILLVKIDGAKIFEDIKTELANDPEFQAQQNDEITKNIASYFENGFTNADFWYTWTVDKTNWQTVTMSFNISGLLQSIAGSALNDTSSPLTSMEPIRQILENVAYYSEFKAYTNFLNPAAKSRLEIPKNVLKAKEVESIIDDDKSKKK